MQLNNNSINNKTNPKIDQFTKCNEKQNKNENKQQQQQQQ